MIFDKCNTMGYNLNVVKGYNEDYKKRGDNNVYNK